MRSFCERLCACSGDRNDTDTAGDATATVKGALCSLALEFAFAFALAFDFACNVSLVDGNDSNGANDDEVAAATADATGEVTDDDDNDEDKVMVDA